MNFKKLPILFVLLSISGSVIAAVPLTSDSVVGMITNSMASAANILLTQALIWLAAFASIQFFITNFGLLKSGADIEAIFAKLIGSLLWLGFCIYVLTNGPGYIGAVGKQFFNLFGISLPSPGGIIAGTILTVGGLAAGAVTAGIISNTAGTLLIYLLIFFFIVGMLFAIKIFMLQLELGLVVLLSPLSFAFLGLNALKDQGIAPFKALLSLGYRILLMTIILSAYTKVHVMVSDAIDATNFKDVVFGFGTLVMTIMSAIGAYIVLGYLLWKSDSIAASLAGGGTSMGTGDVAAAAAAGAALGAAAGAGGAAAVNTAGKAGQSMGDFIKSLNAGSVANDSPAGAGGAEQKMVGTAPPPQPKAAEMSMAEMRNHPNSIFNKSGSADGSSNPSAGSSTNPTKQAVNNPSDVGTSSGSPLSTASSGSGETAGIGGNPSATDQKLDKLMESMGQSKKPTFGDRVATLNDHVAKEQATTTASINTHHAD